MLIACARTPTEQTEQMVIPLEQPAARADEEPSFVIENEGDVCFRPLCEQCAEFTVVVDPQNAPGGCWSSSCTEVLEQSGGVQFDVPASRIQVSSRFLVRHIPGALDGTVGCTTDCSGAGRLAFEPGSLPDGRYSVWHGENEIGTLELGTNGMPRYEQCFQWPPPEIPTEVPYTGPTMTPWPTTVPSPTLTPGPRPTWFPYPEPGPTTDPYP